MLKSNVISVGMPSSYDRVVAAPSRQTSQVSDRVSFQAAASSVVPSNDTSTSASGKPSSIVTSPTYPTPSQLYKDIPQRVNLSYKSEANLASVVFVMLKQGWFDEEAWDKGEANNILSTLSAMHPDYEALIVNVPILMTVDFSSLLEPRHDYATQEQIDPKRVRLLAACAVHYNLDFGLVMRYLGGEYTAKWRDVDAILSAVEDIITPEDYGHIKRILTVGCPANFNWEETDKNKEIFLKRGNNPSIQMNIDLVNKAMNKEERNSHVIPFPRYLVKASTNAHTVPQTVVTRGKPRICWDGTTKSKAYEITMNEITPRDEEADITFGHIYMSFLIWIWNMRISYPDEDILLAFVDISSCFRWPRIFPCLIGAFGFIIGPLFFAANAMVFGSVASATSWEPFRRAISALALSYFGRQVLVQKHAKLLKMVRWSPVEDDISFVQATKCTKNQGITTLDGESKPSPHFIYVDDNLMADIRSRMPFTLAAAIEAVYVIMGFPTLALRQCAIALDKWKLLFIAPISILLGILFNTRDMTVSTTQEYRQSTCDLLDSTWHEHREAFTVKEMEILVGKLNRIGQTYRPIYHLMPHLYASVAYAIRGNTNFLASTNKQYRTLIKRAKTEPSTQDDRREIDFATQQASKMIHSCRRKYRMPQSLKEEIEYLSKILHDDSIQLSTPIAHIVPRDYTFEAACDSSKPSGGGWSTDLRFVWYLKYPEEVLRRAMLPNNKHGDMISINVLEMVCIIINMAAVIYACDIDGVDLSQYPVLLNWCDNMSACAWINHKCKHSLIGRRLARLFVGLIMSTNIGIQAEWISTHLNYIADDISRINKSPTEDDFDFSTLQLTYPILNNCRQFQPSDSLLGMIWEILLKGKSPDPLIVKQLRPSALGRFIS